jgi:hypothetical protein
VFSPHECQFKELLRIFNPFVRFITKNKNVSEENLNFTSTTEQPALKVTRKAALVFTHSVQK